MMQVSQKTRYALRAVFELSRRHGQGPIRIADIAQSQAIPPRFLEGILHQLKQGGLLRSLRGARGGYELARDPQEISVGDLIRLIEGPITPAPCTNEGNPEGCPLFDNCVFLGLWKRAAEALSGVYDGTSFADLVAEDQKGRELAGISYTI